MESIIPAHELPIVLCIIAGFLALIAALVWGQVQTWRADRARVRRG